MRYSETSAEEPRVTTAVDPTTDIDTLCVITMRTLYIDVAQAANSGHPGTPMAMAPVAYTAVAALSTH